MTFKSEPTVTNSKGGMQHAIPHDWTLFPWDGAQEVLQVLMENCDKHGGEYPAENWRLIGRYEHINHAINHLVQALLTIDTALYREHLAHAACRTLFAVSELDDA